MIKRLFKLCLLMEVLSISATAQTRVLEVVAEPDMHGNYVFYADNSSADYYHVTVNVVDISGFDCQCRLPFSGNVGGGRSRLFRLIKKVDSDRNNFNYSWDFGKGFANPKLDEKIIYLLPFAKGKDVEVAGVQDFEGRKRGTSVRTRYAIGFRGQVGDTIFAARRGLVKEIIYAGRENSSQIRMQVSGTRLLIEHADKTFGVYTRLRDEEFMVREGDFVEAGEPLAILGGGATGSVTMQFNVFYTTFDKDMPKGEQYGLADVKTKFATSKSGEIFLEGGSTYKANHDNKYVTQEMSRSQRKRWLKSRSSN